MIALLVQPVERLLKLLAEFLALLLLGALPERSVTLFFEQVTDAIEVRLQRIPGLLFTTRRSLSDINRTQSMKGINLSVMIAAAP